MTVKKEIFSIGIQISRGFKVLDLITCESTDPSGHL